MEEIIYLDNMLQYRGFWFNVGSSYPIDQVCMVNLSDDQSNFDVALVANETTINGVLQTSAQMIIDTLTNA